MRHTSPPVLSLFFGGHYFLKFIIYVYRCMHSEYRDTNSRRALKGVQTNKCSQSPVTVLAAVMVENGAESELALSTGLVNVTLNSEFLLPLAA